MPGERGSTIGKNIPEKGNNLKTLEAERCLVNTQRREGG